MPRVTDHLNLVDLVPRERPVTVTDPVKRIVTSVTCDYGFIVIRYDYTRDAQDVLTLVTPTVIG